MCQCYTMIFAADHCSAWDGDSLCLYPSVSENLADIFTASKYNVKPYFHYGCALRGVQRAAVMEISL